jgi:signal transduction histidine kinase
MTRQAIEVGLRDNPPKDTSEQALQAAVREALRAHEPLADTMNAILRYSPLVQDVSVTDAHGVTLVGTDPYALDQTAPRRVSLKQVRDGSTSYQLRQMFGRPHVLDIALPLDRNGGPFLVVHVGVRSTFLRAAYQPWFREELWSSLAALLLSMLAAALLASAALRPLQRISEQLERLTAPVPGDLFPPGPPGPPSPGFERDAVVRVNRTIDRLGLRIRSTEAEYTALQANLNQMLDTLRDGVLLFTADRRAAMVSDAVAPFIGLDGASPRHETLVGKRLDEIFARGTRLGEAVHSIFEGKATVSAQTVVLEDGRSIQLSSDRIREGAGKTEMGTLLTLRDTESASRLEQELEVSRRLIAIGRLTAGVGHEVKNPINAMVLHLELLRSKLAADTGEVGREAQRHVDILSSEMGRLDRVVQTLADFTRPVELHLAEQDLRRVVSAVLELTGAEMAENGVRIEVAAPATPLLVCIDADLIRQALLNLLLNAMQAMPQGGTVRVTLSREARNAVVEVTDEGEGIPPDLLPRIFDLYFTTKPSGNGIGLAMTYRFLQLHGGALEVRSSTSSESLLGLHGTTFTLRLPLSLPVAFERAGDVRHDEGSRRAAHAMPTQMEVESIEVESKG